MKTFRKMLSGLLGFDRRERRGTYVLSVLLIILITVRLIAFRPGKAGNIEIMYDDADFGTVAGALTEPVQQELFPFDPNTASNDDLLKLGLTERQASTLINYRNSGARFRRPEDISRVYGIDSLTVVRLLPYINIVPGDVTAMTSGLARQRETALPSGEHEQRTAARPDCLPDQAVAAILHGETDQAVAAMPHGETDLAAAGNKPNPGLHEKALLDLNLCNAWDLEQLPGIGPVLSVRIIRYRRLLGGFVSKAQLTEVYGLDTSVVRLISQRVTLTWDSVTPMLLDSVSFGDMARHPYLGYETARVISRYRSLTDGPLTLGAMVREKVITAAQAERIAPYVMPSSLASGDDYEFISSKVLK